MKKQNLRPESYSVKAHRGESNNNEAMGGHGWNTYIVFFSLEKSDV